MAGMFGTDGVRARVNTGAMTAEAVVRAGYRSMGGFAAAAVVVAAVATVAVLVVGGWAD